ncbi:conserved protein of unknown function [Acidithiobacillus ferrivorans]|uniref:Hypervirulence associated protein TUDOR domain-containing protein n=1 Tax=Acidithiobacillus ferrivorans TaxID=160808 RepID=A0A060USY9_9PROT|nr:DUF2945 domain-containing protein [Acidithiobacillus ferrivorans]CDQ09903.1 conserved hypothetical protein [Acidithiobacillus ferrivorans]SMH65771.1 conserved protein of unknown function [Acidithiobacillus ferrivorans]
MKKVAARRFAVGDPVTWNSEAGWVTGVIIAVQTEDFPVHGYIHHASSEDSQYAIQSDKSRHVAYHKGGALRLVGEGSQS